MPSDKTRIADGVYRHNRANARDDLYNGASAPTIDRALGLAKCRAASEEFTRALPSFCKRLDIAPELLNLDTATLLMLVCMRQQAIIDDLAAQILTLRFPPQDTPA